MKRENRIDSVRLIGNLAICGTHAYPFMYASGHDVEFWFWSFFSMNFCIMAMPAFFLISGYLMFMDFSGGGGYLSKMISRVKRLLLPLIIWNFVACIVILALGFLNTRAKANAVDLGLFAFGGWVRQILAFDPLANAPLWYLRAVFVFAVMSPLLYFLYRWLHWFLVVVLCVLAVVLFPRLSSDHYPVYGMALFALGGLSAYKHFNIIDLVDRHRRLFLAFGMIVLAVSCCYNHHCDDIMEPLPIFKFLCAPLFIAIGVALTCVLDKGAISKWILPAGFMIYVGHGVINSCCMHFFGGIIPAGAGRMSLVAMLTVFCTITSLILLWHVCNRACPKILRVLDGKL